MYRLVEENANILFVEIDNQACTGRVAFCYGLSTVVAKNGNFVSGNRRRCIPKQATLLPSEIEP